MNKTHQTDSDLVALLFDAIPAFVFAVDKDVRIIEYNAAAATLLGADRSHVLKRRCGDVLHCLHQADDPGGCGHGPACKSCIVRNAVGEAFHGKRVARRRAVMEMQATGEKTELDALITASPFVYKGKPLVLLVVEDISPITELQRLIPICAKCKKIRNDEDYWMRLETYFRDHWGADFTHCYCPDCYKSEMKTMSGDTPQAPVIKGGPKPSARRQKTRPRNERPRL